MAPITTHGLSHVALSVADPNRPADAGVPGLPYAFVRDPDGYEIEIWFG
jgi:hypothetical protein